MGKKTIVGLFVLMYESYGKVARTYHVMTPDATDNLTKSFKPMNADHENPPHVSGPPPPIAYASCRPVMSAQDRLSDIAAPKTPS